MRWGFLGIGRVTPRMVDAVREAGHSVEMAAARNEPALREWGNAHRVSRLSTDFKEVCDSKDVDAIYVALPPSLHLEYSAYAIACGKHVLCEKPIAVDTHEVEQVAAIQRSPGQMLSHATAFPHHPRSQEIRRRVLGGELGEIKRLTIACSFSHVLNRGRDYRTDASLGGGCLLDLGWYAVFATLWLTGQRPLRIQGVGRKLSPATDRGEGIWISNQGLAELDGGALAHWDCGFDTPGRKWLEIAGTKGSIVCDDFLRPWKADRPRFWTHGSDGKGEEVVCGVGCNQEAAMVQAACDRQRVDETASLFKLGVETQRILERWEECCL